MTLKTLNNYDDGVDPAADEAPDAASASQQCDGNRSPADEPLFVIFDILDEQAIRYCVLHGYEKFPHVSGSDIDCLIDRKTSQTTLRQLLDMNVKRIGAEILRQQGYYFTLRILGNQGRRNYLNLDFQTDCEVDGLIYQNAKQVLGRRTRHLRFWIPATAHEFNHHLLRSLLAGKLGDTRKKHLGELYIRDPRACLSGIGENWQPKDADKIANAMQSGDWSQIEPRLAETRNKLKYKLALRSPRKLLAYRLRVWRNRFGRINRPGGLNVVMLGADGAGKSSAIAAFENNAELPFDRVEVRGFAPPLHRLFKKGPVSTDQPHALRARSLTGSLLKAGYWSLYSQLGYLTIRWSKARNTLILNDRHFLDILVDPVRYRYGGPRAILKLIWWLAPKPDVIILLDAPPDVLHARKPELEMDERYRQRQAYLDLVGKQPNGHIVDATRPFEAVITEIEMLIGDNMAARAKQGLAR